MRLDVPTNSEIETAVEKIYVSSFERYVSPSEYDKLIKRGYNFERFPFGKGIKAKDKIRDLLKRNHFVRSGYMATSVRGYHDKYIIWKP
ncbi:hypothetical protein [Mesonia mobilis]|uniref:hypothetical protein n=1 Tax=Mesonia mobilis TaxID=369791 RepID=UPI0026E98A61|nr:hypothetical protein [Mesonia mobilis]